MIPLQTTLPELLNQTAFWATEKAKLYLQPPPPHACPTCKMTAPSVASALLTVASACHTALKFLDLYDQLHPQDHLTPKEVQ